MKAPHIATLTFALLSLPVAARTAAPAKLLSSAPPHATPWTIVEQGRDRQIWERTTFERSPSGQWIPRKHRYEERATGLNFKDKTGWSKSSETIAILPDGTAAATLANHRAYFPANIYDGMIQVIDENGKRLKSRPLELSYFDGTDSNNVLVAEITNSIGQLVGNNQIIYTNCFTDVAADLVFTFRKDGLEQDVIFRQQPPPPTLWGLDPDNCRMELLTEFFNTAEPAQTPGLAHPRGNLRDTILNFGALTMVRGKAFQVGYGNQASGSAVPVCKTWTHIQGRTFLIEELLYSDIASQLQSLPPSVTPVAKAASPDSPRHRLSSVRLLPPARLAQANTNAIRVADARNFEKPGLVLDYNAVATQTNETFQADATYYVSGTVNLYGTTTIEGNTVIKCDTNTGAALNILGTVNCQTAPYRPAVLTSVGDGTLGESVSAGSSGSCTGEYCVEIANLTDVALTEVYLYDDNADYYASGDYISSYTETEYCFDVAPGENLYLDAFDADDNEYYMLFNPEQNEGSVFVNSTDDIEYDEYGDVICNPAPQMPTTALALANGAALHDLRICNVNIAIDGAANYSITNAQFVNCGTALQAENASVFAGNILMAGVGTGFDGHNFTNIVQQLTFDLGTALTGSGTNCFLHLTNSILTAVSGNGSASITTNKVASLSSSTGVYQSVGGGNYYLPISSPYRAGGANIDSNLAVQLVARTTCAPSNYTNITFTTAKTFSQWVPRDTNAAPDLGYHYDPLDYIFGGCSANSNITFNAGTAVGWYRTASGYYHAGQGIHIGDSQTLAFNGTVTSPDYWARINTVQEQDTTAGYGTGGITSWAGNLAAAGNINARFTRFSMMAADGNHMRDDWGWLVARAWNCEFYSGGAGGYILSLYLTNCLFDRTYLAQVDGNGGCTVDMRNCTMIGNLLQLIPGNVSYYSIRDSAFDGTQFQFSGYAANSSYADYDYNALTNASNPFPFGQSHKVVVTNFNWQSNWFGNFYQTTGSLLIDKGDVSADRAGLYEFTTQTNQAIDGISPVDIGYHYVAVDASGNPISTLVTGVPDYVSDASGNGLPDAWELMYFGNCNQSITNDYNYDGIDNLEEYFDGGDPTNIPGNVQVMLGNWRFDNTNTWVGAQGQLPLAATNVVGVPSLFTNAVRIDSGNPAVLAYREIETNRSRANINLRSGTVQFWFKPDWTSTNAGGAGLGAEGRFIEMGAKGTTNGWWGLVIGAAGTNVYFGTQTNSTSTLATNLNAPVTWVSNQWHQLVLTWSATNSSFYLDGQPIVTNGAGVTSWPGPAARSQGFSIGATAAGTNQARGTFDELQIYNYPLNAATVSSNYQFAVTDTNGLSMTWELNYFGALGQDPFANPAGDGLSNLQKSQNNQNPFQYYNLRLGYWRFNNPPLWADEQGLGPAFATGLYPIPSWSGDAVEINAQAQSVLQYPGVRANGSVVVVPTNGTIRFWFKPDWNAVGSQPTAAGPGGNPRLFEIGRQSTNSAYGWFALQLNPPGTQLAFVTEGGGVHSNIVQAVVLLEQHTWCQVALTFSNNSAAIYLNGQLMGTGVGVQNGPAGSVFRQGFFLGSCWDATSQANGRFEELETFNYQLPAANISSDYSNAMSALAVDGLSAIYKDGWGLRIDAWDSDCDGLADAWEIAHGYNPLDPNDPTNALAAIQAAGTNCEYIGVGSNSVVSWWPAEGTPLDYMGRNDGVLEGGVGYGPGAVGDAFLFDGTTGSILVDPSPTFAVTNFTIEGWINPTINTAMPIIEFSENSSLAGLHFWINTQAGGGTVPGTLYTNFRFHTNDGPTMISSSGLVPFGQWSHVALTYNATSGIATFYLNGSSVVSSNMGSVVPNTADYHLQIGYRPSTNEFLSGTRFSGIIDELAFYNDTLSADQIMGIYQAGGRGKALAFGISATALANSAYVAWTPVSDATNCILYRSVNSTNSWTAVRSNLVSSFLDTNLTVGATNYYQLKTQTQPGTNFYSSIVSAVAFGCPAPLPPRIDYVNPFLVSASESSFPVTWQTLLDNSDAYDPQGFPLVFVVDSVSSGSLTINNAPFAPGNNTITNGASAVWTVPSVVAGANPPAFRVHVFDGVNQSSASVAVFITQRPPTHLFGWGDSTFGAVGDGMIGPIIYTQQTTQPLDFLALQAMEGLWPKDPRWWIAASFVVTNGYTLAPTNITQIANFASDYVPDPTNVLDAADIVCVSTGGNLLSGALTDNGGVLLWGSAEASLFGRPIVAAYRFDSNLLQTVVTNFWTVGSQPPNVIVQPRLFLPSPVAYRLPLTNVQSIVCPDAYSEDAGVAYALAKDGTLWSWGCNFFGQLGRQPSGSNDSFNLNDSYARDDFGMIPGQVVIPDNRKVTQVACGFIAPVALCSDGTVWTWSEVQSGTLDFEYDFTLDGAIIDDATPLDFLTVPRQIISLDTPGAAPIVQMSARNSHYAFLRADGSVSELGYIPSWDDGGYPGYGPWSNDSTNNYSFAPVAVTNLPPNVVQISVGGTYGAAVTSDGNVWVWGLMEDTTNRTPRQILSLQSIVKVATGLETVLAVDNQGTLWAWGLNDSYGIRFSHPPAFSGNLYPGAGFETNAASFSSIENVTDVAASEYVAFAVGTDVLDRPVGLSGIPANLQVSLSWTAYPSASSYVIYRSLNQLNGYVPIGATTGNSFVDHDPSLQNGQMYYYKVAAVVNGIQTAQSRSIYAAPLPPPSAPASVAAVGLCHGVGLAWNPPTNAALSNPQEYRITRAMALTNAFIPIAHCLPTNWFVDETAPPGNSCYYQITAINTAGQSTSATVTGAVDAASCALAPTIVSNWASFTPMWFAIQPPLTDTDSPLATLQWTGPAGGTNWLFLPYEFPSNNMATLITHLQNGDPPIFNLLWTNFSASDRSKLADSSQLSGVKQTILANGFNAIINAGLLDTNLFNSGVLSSNVVAVAASNPQGAALIECNRRLLEDEFNRLYNYPMLISGPNWGANLDGFRIYYRSDYLGHTWTDWIDIGLADAVSDAQIYLGIDPSDPNSSVACFGDSWILAGAGQISASVAPIVGGQVGNASIEAGPLAETDEPADAWLAVIPNAVPGYRQVYLDWQGFSAICQYAMECTASLPGTYATNYEFVNEDSWVTLGNPVSDPRYWDGGLSATNFSPADFKDAAGLITTLTNAADPVSSIIWNLFSASARTNLIAYGGVAGPYAPHDDLTSLRYVLASELSRIIQTNTLVFTTNQASMVGADLSSATRNLLAQGSNTVALNRLLLEDAWLPYIARFEDPSPAEFVSGDIFDPYQLVGDLTASSPSHLASIVWNAIPSATQASLSSGTNSALQLQRILAGALTQLIQTTNVLFATNDVSDAGGVLSSRTLQLYGAAPVSTNSVSLLNRLLLEDAWANPNDHPAVRRLSGYRYYRVDAIYCDNPFDPPYLHASGWVAARPSDAALPPPQLPFTVEASPYDAMVFVEWNIPGATNYNPGDGDGWQFALERQETNGSYQMIAQTGFGLSYLDSDVTDGHTYQYRVTAFDTNYNRFVTNTAWVTPEASDALTLLPPVPGNGYVDLSWTPMLAFGYAVTRAFSTNGPFELIASLPGPNPYDPPQNTYRDGTARNGVTNYYQIKAITVGGLQIDSDIEGAVPLATLPPLPPARFKGVLTPDGGNGTITLSWTPVNGVPEYQVFLDDQTRLNEFYDGSANSCEYSLPDGSFAGETFTFAIRSLNSAGLPGPTAATTVTNIAFSTDSVPNTATNPVVVKIAGQIVLTNQILEVTAPTNLTVEADLNLVDVKYVNFYATDSGYNQQLIGTVNSAPFVMTWFQAPGGDWSITATAFADSGDSDVLTGSAQAFTSDPASIDITVDPPLAAYQTSATDLQLPAPGLPITLSRSYTSRNTTAAGNLGIGWSANWLSGSITLSADINSGWEGVSQNCLGGIAYSIGESASHYVTVTLPNGQSVGFTPQLNYNGTGSIDTYDVVPCSFPPFFPGDGSLLIGGNGSVDLWPTAEIDSSFDWNGHSISFSGFSGSSLSYIDSSGTTYYFGQPGDTQGLVWLVTNITDRAGNSLAYAYNTDGTLQMISNSCGRAVNFVYTNTPSGATNIYVFGPMDAANACVVYYTTNSLLFEVDLITNRASPGYQITRYAYGVDAFDTNNYLRLTSVSDPRGICTVQNTYTHGIGNLLTQVIPGRTNSFGFDASSGNLTVTSASASATTSVLVKHNQSGAIAGATQPASGGTPASAPSVTCAYDANGNVISQTDTNGNSKTYSYDDQNRLIGQTDENGKSTSQQLNQFGQPTNSVDANGNATLYAYDDAGNPTNVVDPSGTTNLYTWSAPVIGPTGQVLVGEQQASQVQKAPFVPYWILTTNTYDTNLLDSIKGNLLSTTEQATDLGGNPFGPAVTTSYTYDANGNRLTEVKSRTVNGSTQYITNAYTYDAQNRVIMTVVSAGGPGAPILLPQTNTITYNTLGKQYISIDAAGRGTTNIYDFNGNLIEVEYPDGTVSRTAYDTFNRQQYVQDKAIPDASGNTVAPATYNIYDPSGRVIQTERRDGVQLTKTSATTTAGDFTALSSYESQWKMVVGNVGTPLTTNLTFYDSVGRVQYSVDPRGVVTQKFYDPAGRRTNVLVYLAYTFTNQTATPSPTGLAESTAYAYDANGNQVSVTDALGHTTTSEYDAANRVIEVDYPSTLNSQPSSQFTTYDGLGRKITQTDESGITTSYQYDFRGLLAAVTLASGTTQAVTTTYEYDEQGNMTNQVDAAGHSTLFTYDALGRRTGRTLPAGQTEGYTYDRWTGNLNYQTNFNGVVITNQYDVDNRLTNHSAPGGYRISFAYNPTNGLRTNMVDLSGTNAYAYDSQNRLVKKTASWIGGPSISLNYGYDNTGLLTNLWSSTSSGVSNAYRYDSLGRLTNVLANGSSAASYCYDIVGNLQTMRYGNGVTNLYQYDSRNRLTNLVWNLNGSQLASFAYQLGPTGNRTGLNESVNGAARTYSWAYDYLYRLTGENITGSGNVGYSFDAVGNRTHRTSGISGVANQSFLYNQNDWLTNTDSYDNNGNTTVSSGSSYQYDVENHLTNANSGAVIVGYDGDGNRVKKTVGGTNTYYLVDDHNPSGYAQVLEEYQGTNLSCVYNYGSALISQRQVPSGTISYFGVDGHNSTRFLTSTSGAVSDTYIYDAYGVLIASIGSTPNNYLYSGEQFDSDLGMYYLRARYYKPDTGRFWTMDSYGGDNEDPQSLHKYLYCSGNPINMVDRNGQDGEIIEQLAITAIRTALFAMNAMSAVHNAKQFANDVVSVYQGVADDDPWNATLGVAGAVMHGGLAAMNIMGVKSFLSSIPPPPAAGVAVAGGGTVAVWQLALSNPGVGKWVFEEFLPVVGTGLGFFASSMPHEVAWDHRNSEGQRKAYGTMESGSEVDKPGRLDWNEQLETHTEWKILSQLTNVKEGDIITMRGDLPPCNPGERGCWAVMKAFADRHKVKIIYSIAGGKTWEITQ